MTTISVILPTYNRAHVLERALTSVFGQTHLPDEVIVVDDASTDATADVVKRFPHVRLHRLERNSGAAHARNAGAKLATGEYIAFLDSDDLWLSNKLEVQLVRMNESPAPDLICSGITVQERNGSVAYHGFFTVTPPEEWSFGEFQSYPFCPSNWLIRRATFLGMGLFDESMPNCEDLDFLARMAGRHRIEVMSQPLTVKYNQSDSLDTNRARTAVSYDILFSRHRNLWLKAPAAAGRSYQRLANMHIIAGDMTKARAALMSAARYQPWRIKFWVLALFGKTVYTTLKRLR